VSAGPSLYRRHRPRTFADVVGQEHVVRTLSHAVERDQIHHAYLFVGSRGTGKTSMAKILAACLNCVNGPTISPCGVCDSCISIASATSLDVIEMDAASNNSVDDIRNLRETVAYAPVSGRHKVYILDEAHMLSTQAWNAFLKTLEEPPPRTVFVLATTEAQKVLPTVVDRCHRFDFGRPSAEQVMTVVRRVAEQESIRIEDGAAALIARQATGSFRDALGTLEQLVTYAGEEAITAEDVLTVLGVADAEQLFGAVDAIVSGDPAAALRATAALAGSGRDPGQVLRDLEVHGRELLTVQIIGEVPAELRVTPERDQRLVAQAKTLAATDAVRLLELVSAALEATANGAQPRIQLELALIKAAAPEMDPSTSALLARIERLERGGVRPAPVPPAAAPVQSASAVAPDPPQASQQASAGVKPEQGVAPAAPVEQTSEAKPPTAVIAGVEDPAAPAPEPAPVTPAPDALTSDTVTRAATPLAAAAAEEYEPGGDSEWGDPGDYDYDEIPVELVSTAPTPPVSDSSSPAPVESAAPAPEPVASSEAVISLAAPEDPRPTPDTTSAGSLTVEEIRRTWPAVVELVRGSNAMLAVLLESARPTAVSERELVLCFPVAAAFYKRKAEQDDYRKATAEAVRNVTGASLALRYELAEALPESEDPAPVMALVPMGDDELVRKFVDEFGAEEILQDDHEAES
jgi:DNA polymerase-3 subunit gamma/tau